MSELLSYEAFLNLDSSFLNYMQDDKRIHGGFSPHMRAKFETGPEFDFVEAEIYCLTSKFLREISPQNKSNRSGKYSLILRNRLLPKFFRFIYYYLVYKNTF